MNSSHQPATAAEMKPALQKRSQKKADLMLKAGYRLIETQSLESMRIGDIATEAGCSVGSFYTRFHDKESFFQLLLENNMERSISAMTAYLEPSRWEGKSAEKIMTSVVTEVTKWFRARKGLYCAALSAPGQPTFTPFRRQHMNVATCLGALLETRRDEMDCKDFSAAIWFAVQMLSGTLVLAAFSDRAAQSGTRTPDDKSILIDDPQLVEQLTRSTCAYLGIKISGDTAN